MMHMWFDAKGAGSYVDSASFGVYLIDPFLPETAEKEVDYVDVPGREGALTIDKGGLKNRATTIKAYIEDKANLAAFLAAFTGYGYLRPSNDSDYYYRVVLGDAVGSTRLLSGMSVYTLDIPCTVLPYKYFASSSYYTIDLTDPAPGVVNRGHVECRPRIRITPVNNTAGWSVTINGYTVSSTTIHSQVLIECELEECFNSAETAFVNDKIVLSDGFPRLRAGTNLITFNNINALAITVRDREK